MSWDRLSPTAQDCLTRHGFANANAVLAAGKLTLTRVAAIPRSVLAEIEAAFGIAGLASPADVERARQGRGPELSSTDGDGKGAKPWRRQSLDESEQVTCWRCEQEIGIATSAVIEVTLAPRRAPNGKKVGGTKVWACVFCMSRGKMTELIKT